MNKNAFDLFDGLSELTAGNLQWYDNLSDEGKKSAAPLIIARWLSGTSDPAQIVRLNTFVNPYVFSLGTEKPLLFKLIASSTTRRPKRYYWLKNPGSKGTKKMAIEVAKEYYGWSTREAELHTISAEDSIKMAEELGWDDEQIKKLKKEFK